MKLKNLLLTGLFATVLIGCSSEDDNAQTSTLEDFQDGILVLNEGFFGGSNASVSFIPQDLSEIQNNIFAATNNMPLGDVAQSIGFNQNEAYIVVNNSDKIEVVDKNSFESISSIETGLESPRYFVAANGKGYVSNWGDPTVATDDFVAVINLTDYTVENTISVSEGPERIIAKDGKIFISHLGGYTTNNVISVIEGTNVVEIEVHDNPDELTLDSEGNLWVLSQGIVDWSGAGADTPGALVKINTATNEVTQTLEFEATNHPDLMTYNNGKIYYSAGGEIFEINSNATQLATEPIFTGYFYGMEANNGKLYATDAGDFSSQGTVKVFDLSSYTEITSFTTGIAPNRIYFNN